MNLMRCEFKTPFDMNTFGHITVVKDNAYSMKLKWQYFDLSASLAHHTSKIPFDNAQKYEVCYFFLTQPPASTLSTMIILDDSEMYCR